MGACAPPRAGARARGPSRRTRPESRCPLPLAGAGLARASGDLPPGSVEHTLWYHEVPWLHEPPGLALAIEVARLARSLVAEGLQVVLLDEEGLALLLQEEAHARRRERGAQLERIGDDGGEIEVLDHLQRSPDLFPPAAKIGGVEHVDERALEGRHPNGAPGVGLGDHPAAAIRQPVERTRRPNSDELAALEAQRPQVTSGEHREAMPDRVRLAPELQRRVEGDRCV